MDSKQSLSVGEYPTKHGQRSLVVRVSQAGSKTVHGNAVIVNHKEYLPVVDGSTAKRVSHTGAECIGHATEPKGEKRIPERVREVDATRESYQPAEPYPQWNEMSPEVPHVVVKHEHVLHTPQEGVARSTVTGVYVRLPEDWRDVLSFAQLRAGHG